MSNKDFITIASGIFLTIGVVHALRLWQGWPVQIGTLAIPMWVSWLAVALTFSLSYSGFRMGKK